MVINKTKYLPNTGIDTFVLCIEISNMFIQTPQFLFCVSLNMQSN
jgi:hypothetical protein